MAPRAQQGRIAAVIFDLDGVLLDSESAWVRVKKEYTEETGGHWQEGAQWDMLGMSSTEWSRYMHDQLGVPVDPERISAEVADRLVELYRERLPLLPGAVDAVGSLGGRVAAGPRLLLEPERDRPGARPRPDIADEFEATVSSEEVERGKPAPDVYLEAARRLGVEPGACAAIEDSTNGIRSAHAAGMAVIAIPNQDFPPEREALDLAAVVLDSLEELSPERVRSLAAA